MYFSNDKTLLFLKNWGKISPQKVNRDLKNGKNKEK